MIRVSDNRVRGCIATPIPGVDVIHFRGRIFEEHFWIASVTQIQGEIKRIY